MNAVAAPAYEWERLRWRKLERAVFKLQERIYQAQQRGNVQKGGLLARGAFVNGPSLRGAG